MFIVFFVGQSILSGQHINIGISHPGVVRALFGSALFLTAMGLFGLGLGAIVRNTAGGIAALAGIIFVLPPVIGLLPTSIVELDRPLPARATRAGRSGRSIPIPTRSRHGPGFALFCGYVALAFAMAAVLLRTRDT